MNSDSLQVRMLDSSLLLLGALVYYINCLHSRPDDLSHSRSLCGAIFPLTDDPESPDHCETQGVGKVYKKGWKLNKATDNVVM